MTVVWQFTELLKNIIDTLILHRILESIFKKLRCHSKIKNTLINTVTTFLGQIRQDLGNMK